MKRLLVIDSLNLYLRNWIINPSLSTNGSPLGGVKGTIQSLQKLCREVKPDEVVFCWDGQGGSQRRKSVNKNYKEGRKPIRMNRDVSNMSDAEQVSNKIWQQTRLFEYLNELPVIQLMLPAIEADDVISHVVQHPKYKGWQKVIVSSDKDFFQLCDDETVVYRPIQKKIVNRNNLIDEFGIHPKNFALARAIVGDSSDNLTGVSGVGLKTIKNRLSFLSEDKSYEISEVMDYCENTESKVKAYQSILEGRETVMENYRLMQLYVPSISPQGTQKLNYALDNFEPELGKTTMLAMMMEDGFGESNFNELFAMMRKIIVDSRQ